MNEELYETLLKLPRKNLVNLMYEALDYMNQYNGRTRQQCVLMAMGGKRVEKENGKVFYHLGTFASIKKNTEHEPI